MGYKIFGGVLLLLAGCYIALMVVRFEKRRLRVMDGYISLLFYIKGQIDCYATPVSDILKGVDPYIIADCLGISTHNVNQNSIQVSNIGLYDLLSESGSYLEPETRRLLGSFTNELGGCFREEQLRRCDYYIEALTEERSKLNESVPVRMRVNSILCVCCAIGAAVLLW